MSVADSISDLIAKINTYQKNNKQYVEVKETKIIKGVLEVLKIEGYIEGFEKDDSKDSIGKWILVKLKYYKGRPVISEMKKVSKCSLREYVGYRDIPSVKNGLGISIISTPKGIVSDKVAKYHKVGGEILCSVF